MVKTRKEKSLREQFKDTPSFCRWGIGIIALFSLMLLVPASAISADELPENIIVLIEKKAVDQFPYDRTSQMRVIESQKSAYSVVHNYTDERVPEDILTGIKKRAAFECPTNYCAQKYLIETQARDCGYLRNYSPEGVPSRILKRMIHNAEEEFPNDYSTQKMVVDVKVKEYLSYDRVTQLEYCGRELDAALDEMEEVLLSLQEKCEELTQKLEETQQEAIQKEETRIDAVQIEAIERKEVQDEEIQTTRMEVFNTAALVRHYHVVKRGENLYRISLRYGLPLNKLCRMNGITPENTIWPGQRILISL